MISETTRNNQHGQVLVQAALTMVVLLGFLALAVDAGHAYAERRRMQNAADAGALAGARELCFGDFGNYTSAESVAYEYAVTRNNAGDQTLITAADWSVNVQAQTTADTFFAQVLNIEPFPVVAEAEAACGRATSSCGLWPVAYDVTQWRARQSCGARIIIWAESSAGEVDCINDYYCDVDGDGVDDPLPPEGLVWVDFSNAIADGAVDPCDGSGGGSNELKYRIHGCVYNNPNAPCTPANTCGSWIEIPACVGPGAGTSGVSNAAWAEAADAIGRIIRFPLYRYDETCTLPGGTPGNTSFPLVDFGCGSVYKVDKLCQRGPGACNGPRYIMVEIPCVNGQMHPQCYSDCGTTAGGTPGVGDVRAVSLTK